MGDKHIMLPTTSDTQTSEIPAQDWTPEQQIARMLGLCEAQMESAIGDADTSVDTLVKAFTEIVASTRAIEAAAPNVDAQLRTQLDAIGKQMTAAIVAFQFYDKLTQRLEHVRYSLSSLAMFVCDRSQSSQRDQWRRLFTALKRLYRTEEERQLFQLMVEGATAEEALAKVSQPAAIAQLPKTGEVEFF
jgi:hypothetical protein